MSEISNKQIPKRIFPERDKHLGGGCKKKRKKGKNEG